MDCPTLVIHSHRQTHSGTSGIIIFKRNLIDFSLSHQTEGRISDCPIRFRINQDCPIGFPIRKIQQLRFKLLPAILFLFPKLMGFPFLPVLPGIRNLNGDIPVNFRIQSLWCKKRIAAYKITIGKNLDFIFPRLQFRLHMVS